jgi:hypothetical protein
VAGSKYVGSYSGIGEMLRADFMVEEMGRRAQAVMDQAVATAPVYTGTGRDTHRGRYKDAFSMHTTDHGGWKGDRAAGIVTNDAPEAVFVEFSSKHPTEHGIRMQPGHHTLLNALYSAAGD